MVKAWVSEFEAECILPVDASSHRIRRLAIRQALDKLEHGDQGQPCRGLCGLTQPGEQIGKLVVFIDGAQRIGIVQAQGAVGERGAEKSAIISQLARMAIANCLA